MEITGRKWMNVRQLNELLILLLQTENYVDRNQKRSCRMQVNCTNVIWLHTVKRVLFTRFISETTERSFSKFYIVGL
jgi:hypothetical protein